MYCLSVTLSLVILFAVGAASKTYHYMIYVSQGQTEGLQRHVSASIAGMGVNRVVQTSFTISAETQGSRVTQNAHMVTQALLQAHTVLDKCCLLLSHG